MNISSSPVWIIDNDPSIHWLLEQALQNEGFESRSFFDAQDALENFGPQQPALIAVDAQVPGMDCFEFLEHIQRRKPELPVIVMVAYSDLNTTVEALQRGAHNYLPKPFNNVEAITLIRNMMQSSTTDTELDEPFVPSTMIGESPAMQELFRTIRRLSKSRLNVLVTGESGTGKELVARALFANSQRKKKPFVVINAEAIPMDLLESELFGYEAGAFAGASQQRIGGIEKANGGTLFLDEIGDLPLELQGHLLRVLSDGKFYRFGGTSQVSVNVRIIATTNRNLEELVRQNKFRADLYHRLNALRVNVVPVRERTMDIPLLVRAFLRRAAKHQKVAPKEMSPEAMRCLTMYKWPGNVREIINVCRLLVVTTSARTISVKDLPPDFRPTQIVEDAATEALNWQSPLVLHIQQLLYQGEENIGDPLKEEFDEIVARTAIEFFNGSKTDAAKRLGWSRNRVYRKMQDTDDTIREH